jgi:hypothetical protein
MNDDELLKHRLNLELESISMNQLTELGNRAIQLGLIAGHGYRGGQYEILHQGKAVMLSPKEAQVFLSKLIQSVES